MQQLFCKDSDIVDGVVTFTGETANHIGRALRMRVGEMVRLSTDSEKNYICRIISFTKDSVSFAIETETEDTEPSVSVTIFQAVPKGDRMENVIEKTVELGVRRIVPVEMKNCVVRIDEKKKPIRLARWRKIAESAARQSKRSAVPEISDFISFKEAASMMDGFDIALTPYENETGMKETALLRERISPGMNIGIMIGPEGGFAPEEVSCMEKHSDMISLGRRILRTDTAAIAMMSYIMIISEIRGEK
jgi:16S rRNA (uracil1498-N3)-methyltransferase